ncbi:DUF1800 domain-containing protein [Teredinibacter turnerae]|uniref:DUF1800 domain-containing protein n=1 Tax=Teredinibacter turnerae TaxID=2426 RepID=UPI00036A882C|nr:DUF1800 family protein [Teredinibacter turnerae]
MLDQATFGTTAKTLVAAMEKSREQWLDEQIALPQTLHLPLLDERLTEIGFEPAPEVEKDDEGWVRDIQRSDIWWESAVWGQDQLRQRVAYALSQILVISNVSDVLYNDSRGIANYHDILAAHAFGSYRDLLKAVTLNPMMGEYLSMVRNEKADAQRNIRPDENYAREVMQLFSIGLVQLNIDGSPVLDNQQQPVPTYGQDDIKNLARVFTGWNHATINQWWEWASSGAAEILPMKAFPAYHDTGSKTLFGDKSIPADLTPEQDIDAALDILFAHSNVAPFISKQLIQRLITSNPSPDYVARVASVFNDNGAGEKGDLKAVIKAIYLDDEAINGPTLAPTTFGKLREPLLKVTGLWRAFKAQGIPVRENNGSLSLNRLRFRGSDREMGQRPYGSFSVFNFYRPDYQQPGEIKNNDLIAPEFQIMTDSQLVSSISRLSGSIFWRDTKNAWPQSELTNPNNQPKADWDLYPAQLFLEEEKQLANDPSALVERLNLLLLHGTMSTQLRATIIDFITEFQPYSSAEMRVYDALVLVMASPEYAIQR